MYNLFIHQFLEVILVVKIIHFVFLTLLLSGCSSVRYSSDNSAENTVKDDKAYIKNIISEKESENGIPNGILSSIAAVESQYKPYAINAKNKSYNFNSKEEAAKFIKTSVNHKCTNISVGCLQIHYKTHHSKFSSIDSMLAPEDNISYGAKLLKSLYTRHGSWEKAIKFYHTSKAKYNRVYYAKVMKKYNSIIKAH